MIVLGSPEALLSGKWRQMILSWNKRLVAVAIDKTLDEQKKCQSR